MTAPSRGRPRSKDLDAAIMGAALELFIEHGIAGMSIAQVARRAGVGKPTVYRRWSGKEQLIADAIEAHVSADVQWSIRDEIAAGSPETLVRRNLTGAARTATDPRFRALVAQIYGLAVTHPKLMQTYWDRTSSLAVPSPSRCSSRHSGTVRSLKTPISTFSSTCWPVPSHILCRNPIRRPSGRCGAI